MTATLNALRQEHHELLPRIEHLKQVADVVDLVPVGELGSQVGEVEGFLRRDLTPHARAEEDVLYRAYDQVADSPWATDTMRRDHATIAGLSEELAYLSSQLATNALTTQQKQDLRRILYGLYTLIRQHFSHEEDLLLPRIEAAVTQEAADRLIQSMEVATAGYRADLQQL
jgi:hemerythrin-like domain-containing protein